MLLLGLLEEGERYGVAVRTFGGAAFCVLTLPRERLRRGAALWRGVRMLRRRGVRRCVFYEGFAQEEYFAARGITAVDARALLRRKAGAWTLIERESRGLCGTVAVAAERMTPATEQIVRLLLRHTASVLLREMPGAERVQMQLRRESGAVVRLIPPASLARAETLLTLDEPALAGAVLTLCPQTSALPRFVLPSPWQERFSPRTDRAALSAALWEMGCVEAEKIGLKSRI